MKKLDKHILGMAMIALAFIGAVVVAFVLCAEENSQRLQQMENERNAAVELYFEAIKKQNPMRTGNIWTDKSEQVSLDELTSKGARLYLYINKSQCDLCWKEALEYLEECDSLYKGVNSVVLLSGFQPNDLKRVRQSCSLPLFLVDDSFGADVDLQKGFPLLFVLNPNEKINYIFSLEDKSPFLKGEYMKRVDNYCQTIKVKPEVRAVNASIQLGNIGLRRKIEVNLLLKNDSEQNCKVVDVGLSCDCMKTEHFTRIVKARSNGLVKVVLVPERKGLLYRTVSVKMSNGQIVGFEIKANVV